MAPREKASLHTYKQTWHVPTYTPTYLHTYIHYLPTHVPTYLPTYLHTYMPTYLHTYIPAYLTYLPTYIHTYIPNLSLSGEAPFAPSTVTRKEGGRGRGGPNHRKLSHKNCRAQGIFPLPSVSLIKLKVLVGHFFVNGGFSGIVFCKVEHFLVN